MEAGRRSCSHSWPLISFETKCRFNQGIQVQVYINTKQLNLKKANRYSIIPNIFKF